jgi:adenine phosphoribosyltransferase
MSLKDRIRTISDHPRPGVQFRDITTLLRDPDGLRAAAEGLVAPFAGERIDVVAGIEARGFILGGAVALALRAGFVPVRKAGKLPAATVGQDYALEYGSDRVEVHADALRRGERVLLVDDLIATGGTAEAAIRVIECLGGVLAGVAAVIDLPALGGRQRLEKQGYRVVALCAFDGA